MSGAPLDSRHFRQVLSMFPTGVTVVTVGGGTGEDSGLHGMTCNSLSSVSSRNAMITVCLTRDTRTERLVAQCHHFVVNVLDETQASVADRFAGRHREFEADRFRGIAWRPGATGAPLLEGAVAHLECRLERAIDCDDHTLFLARVVAAGYADQARPLVFFRSGYARL